MKLYKVIPTSQRRIVNIKTTSTRAEHTRIPAAMKRLSDGMLWVVVWYNCGLAVMRF